MDTKPKKRRRAPKDVLADKHAYARHLIGRACFRSEAVARIQQRFRVTKAEAFQVVDEAQEQLYAEHKARTGDDWVIAGLEVYRKVIDDPESTPGDRIRAQQRIDRLLGLEAPKRVRIEGDLEGMTVDQLLAEEKRLTEGG